VAGTRIPFLDAARKLIRLGTNPDALIIMRHCPARTSRDRGGSDHRRRPLSIQRRLVGASPLQWLPQIRHPTRQRSARPWRSESIFVLRSYEGLHRRTARRSPRGRKEPARIQHIQLLWRGPNQQSQN
jgi:hypothetical protein